MFLVGQMSGVAKKAEGSSALPARKVPEMPETRLSQNTPLRTAQRAVFHEKASDSPSLPRPKAATRPRGRPDSQPRAARRSPKFPRARILGLGTGSFHGHEAVILWEPKGDDTVRALRGTCQRSITLPTGILFSLRFRTGWRCNHCFSCD